MPASPINQSMLLSPRLREGAGAGKCKIKGAEAGPARLLNIRPRSWVSPSVSLGTTNGDDVSLGDCAV